MSWNKILVTGLVASVAIVGCTVTTSSDVGDAASGGGTDGGGKATGGSTSTGGAGGASTGGAKATGGGTSAGGASAGGNTSADAGPESDCTKCLKEFCLDEYNACGKDKDCGQTATSNGEFYDIQACMFAITGDSSVPVFTQTDLEGCVGAAATATTELVTCMRGAEDASTQPCTERCYGAPVPYK